MIEIGDAVSAEYITGISGKTGNLEGIVIGIGDWEGKRTVSVAGFDQFGEVAFLSASTMPVRLKESRLSESARKLMSKIHSDTKSDRSRARLETVAGDCMGMSL